MAYDKEISPLNGVFQVTDAQILPNSKCLDSTGHAKSMSKKNCLQTPGYENIYPANRIKCGAVLTFENAGRHTGFMP
jgi:hypothetical protein